MTQYLIASHGGLAPAAKQALEMIAGERPDVAAVGLLPEEGPEQFQAKLSEATAGAGTDELLIVFTDLRGGSPHNAVVTVLGERENTLIVSGFNLPMMLDTVLSMQENPAEIAAAGQTAITTAGTLADAAPQATEPKPAAPAPSAPSGSPKEVVHVRLDARGIHGQVATTLLPQLKADRVIVIDAKAVRSDMQKMALRTALADNIKLSVLSPKRAAERLADPAAYPGERILVLLLDPLTLNALSDEGKVFEQVNLGNLPARPGATQLRKTVYLTDEDRAALKAAKEAGTTITAQMVPADPLVDVGDQL